MQEKRGASGHTDHFKEIGKLNIYSWQPIKKHHCMKAAQQGALKILVRYNVKVLNTAQERAINRTFYSPLKGVLIFSSYF
jgi:hypothetical protein